MDQASAFQVYTAMKKFKPLKQKNPKRLKKENQSKSLNIAKKNVKEKIENALQDLELVQVKMSAPKQKKRKNKKGNKFAKQANSEPNQHQAAQSNFFIDSDSDNKVMEVTKNEPAFSSIQQNPRRSSVHEKKNPLNVSFASSNAKKENKPKTKKQNDSLVQKDVSTQKVLAKEKKESRLNSKESEQLGNSAKDDPWFKSVLAIAQEYSASLDSSDETLVAQETKMNDFDNTSDSMDSGDLYFEDTSEDEEMDHSDPFEDSKLALDFLLHPISSELFFGKYWEKTPMLIKGGPKKFFTKGKSIVNTAMIDQVLRNNNIQFTKNLDITTYTNGVRETHNPEGRAYPSVVWDYYLNDCSIRMLNPQTYIPALHVINSTLQEFFGCFVGANLYLTPPNSQGFAPHYDDIEAFILQVEGQKRWRLYKPRSQSEVMPRYSSKNFTDAEIGKPFMDVVLKQGDLLYFPRGTIHQGETIDGKHSLHVTLSVYQKNSWADFMEKLVPQALKSAIDDNAKFRTGMPLGYLRHIGTAYEDTQNEMRDSVMSTARNLMEKMMKYIDVDKAADEMAKCHTHDFLPPSLHPEEAECSIIEDGEKMVEDGKTSGLVEIEPDTEIRLVRHHCARLIKDGEDNTYKLFYSTENSKVYHEYELQYLEIGEEYVPGIKMIINEFPKFVRVEDLPIDGLDLKIQLAKDLWEKCLVITKNPLPTMMD